MKASNKVLVLSPPIDWWKYKQLGRPVRLFLSWFVPKETTELIDYIHRREDTYSTESKATFTLK